MYKKNFLEFYKFIDKYDDFNYLLAILRFLTSPTSSNIKIATLVNICNSSRKLKDIWSENKDFFRKILNVDYFEFRESKNFTLVYFYKKKLLKEILLEESISNYLISLNYREYETVKEYLNVLKSKFIENNSCPNEIGVFLGYPLNDVIDFECKNKECKLSGYWKCYNDIYASKNTFEKYDNEKLKIIEKYYKDAI